MHCFKSSACFPPHFGFLSSLDLIFPTSHRSHKVGAGNKKTDLLPTWGHVLTCQKFCGCPSFQHFYLLSCPGKNGLDGWQGKSFQPRETSRMSGGGWMHPVPVAPSWNSGRVKRERLCCLFNYWLLFPTSSFQRFSLCQPGLVLRGTLNLPQ